MRFLIIYLLIQILFFGTVLGHFSQRNFNFFCCQLTMIADTFTQCLQHEKASYGLAIMSMLDKMFKTSSSFYIKRCELTSFVDEKR